MFDPDKLYLADDEALKVIGSYWKLAKWRYENRGPAYVRIGAKIAYRGSDILAWLDRQTIQTRESQDAAA